MTSFQKWGRETLVDIRGPQQEQSHPLLLRGQACHAGPDLCLPLISADPAVPPPFSGSACCLMAAQIKISHRAPAPRLVGSHLTLSLSPAACPQVVAQLAVGWSAALHASPWLCEVSASVRGLCSGASKEPCSGGLWSVAPRLVPSLPPALCPQPPPPALLECALWPHMPPKQVKGTPGYSWSGLFPQQPLQCRNLGHPRGQPAPGDPWPQSSTQGPWWQAQVGHHTCHPMLTVHLPAHPALPARPTG